VKKPQWITIAVAVSIVVLLYAFGKTVSQKKPENPSGPDQHLANDGHVHDSASGVSIDTILALAKKGLTTDQSVRINTLENSISRGAVKDQQLKVYKQLARFWADSAGIFEPFAWYEAEAARLENSEKSLTFAARLFLDNLQNDQVVERKKWKAFQAKDLFERSLKINPDNDSAKVGLGAAYLFGNISSTPMEGILKIREVVEKDSTNTYAQLMLVRGALLSGQYDKAISRLETITRIEPDNAEAIVLLADVYAYMGDKTKAVDWYKKSLDHIRRPDARTEILNRIQELTK
jgi:tetratricopeptide (TPR) repeat protein